MKKPFFSQWKISLRNLAVFLIAAATILFISEKCAVSYKAVPQPTEEERAEDTALRYMMLRKTPPENLSALTFSETLINDYYGIPVPDKTLTDAVCYPLIDLKTSEAYNDETVNIVVIGDSFVWGDGCTNQNELFWRLLERDLRADGYNCRVYGVGLGAANAYEELTWLKDSTLADDLRPDIVIFGFVHNDPADGVKLKYLLQNNNVHLSERYPVFRTIETAFPSLCARLSNLIAADTLMNGKYGDEEYAVYLEEVLNDYRNDFVVPLNEYAAEAVFPIAVTTLPSMPHNLRLQKLHERIAQMYGAVGHVRFYDATKRYDRFCANRNHRNNIYASNANDHPGSAVNRFYADYIRSFLKKDYPEILGKRGSETQACSIVSVNDTIPPLSAFTEISSSETCAQYSFAYPIDEKILISEKYDVSVSSLLRLPINKPYVKLCFEAPVRIEELTLSGENLTDAEIFCTVMNDALRYDDHETKPFGQRTEDGFRWMNESKEFVSSLLISADFKQNADRTLTVSVTGDAGKE